MTETFSGCDGENLVPDAMGFHEIDEIWWFSCLG